MDGPLSSLPSTGGPTATTSWPDPGGSQCPYFPRRATTGTKLVRVGVPADRRAAVTAALDEPNVDYVVTRGPAETGREVTVRVEDVDRLQSY